MTIMTKSAFPQRWSPGLVRAVTAVRSVTELARRLKTSTGAIYRWDDVPAERLVDFEKATTVPRHELRPDIFEGYCRKAEPQNGGATP